MWTPDLIVLGVVLAVAGLGIVYLGRRTWRRRRAASARAATTPGAGLTFRRVRRVYTMRRRALVRR